MNKKRLLSILITVVLAISLVSFALAAPAADAATNGEPLPWYAGVLNSGVLPIIVIVAVFYFVLIRPENKRKKETTNMRNNLTVGDEVTTIGGIIGKVTNVRDDEITLETSHDRTKLRLKKWAISSVDKKKDAVANSTITDESTED